jgi:hypothetical protein
MIQYPQAQKPSQTVTEYNSISYGKAWAIIGMTWEGKAYCLDCVCNWPTYENDDISGPIPVFSSDDYENMSCDSCRNAIYAPLMIGVN